MGDVLDRLREMPDESVHCVVTSPPYWGLRDYGTAEWDGGDAECDHRHVTEHQKQGTTSQRGGRQNVEEQRNENFRDVCRRCGARRIDQQLGLEPTPAAYLARMVEVFREVRRVLRSDGTCWVNMAGGYTDKQMDGMPWRLAFALQDDGWWLRSEIIWAKPNPMPESVTDRPTKAHEQIFLLTKSARYWYDSDAIREPIVTTGLASTYEGRGQSWHDHQNDKELGDRRDEAHNGKFANPAGRNARDVWSIATEPFPDAHFATFPTELPRRCIAAGTSERGVCPACGAPWTRVVEREQLMRPRPRGEEKRAEYAVNYGYDHSTAMPDNVAGVNVTTTGWQPSCTHTGDPVPATVLDPFAGSGTTIMVALRLGRSAIGIELNPTYADMARKRIVDDHGAVQPTNGDMPTVAVAQGRFDW